MDTLKTTVHFTDQYLINPTNPISINLIGAGGTGSKVLTALLEMNHCLITLGHPGLLVRLWDHDIVSDANIGRQRFAQCEVGLYKAVALINRVNRWAGTNWKAETKKFGSNLSEKQADHIHATITITCVDNVKTRFEVAEMLENTHYNNSHRDTPKYWIDFGNTRDTGQVFLSTLRKIKQPDSRKYHTAATLPMVTREFGDLLIQSEEKDDTPSCSLAEALEKQELFINATLAQMGCSLLWSLFRNGMTAYRGFFLNLKNFNSQPLKINPDGVSLGNK